MLYRDEKFYYREDGTLAWSQYKEPYYWAARDVTLVADRYTLDGVREHLTNEAKVVT